MGSTVRVTVNKQRLDLRLEGLREKLANLSPVMKILGVRMISSIERTFREQGSPRGSWPPLTPKVRKRYEKRGILAGHKLLILSGRLKNSIAFRAERNRLAIGTNVIYARPHQLGGGGIPARPFLVFRPEDPQRLQEAARDYLMAKKTEARG
jgi:phage virion morphogenesis protein